MGDWREAKIVNRRSELSKYAEEALSHMNKCTLDRDFFKASRATYSCAFGAFAEFVDNARDAAAERIFIDYNDDADRKKCTISFLDNGSGMDFNEAISVIRIGYSRKKDDTEKVGHFGNGMKSGAAAISDTMTLFTKKNDELTCIFISNIFNDHLKSTREVIVPMPKFNLINGEPVPCYTDDESKKMHDTEMDIIVDYSHFGTRNDIVDAFSEIKGSSGTLIYLSGLRMNIDGDFELSFKDSDDIKLHQNDGDEERTSLRSFLSILYLNPKMQIFVRGSRVRTKRITAELMGRSVYEYSSKSMKLYAEKAVSVALKNLNEARDALNQAKSAFGAFEGSSGIREFTTRNADGVTGNSKRRALHSALVLAEADVSRKEKEHTAAVKAVKQPVPFQFIFGYNIHQRSRYGLMVYNNGRLIEMFKKPKRKEDQEKILGVIGVVNISSNVLEANIDKLTFSETSEYNSLMRAFNEHLQHYAAYPHQFIRSNMQKFWADFGYPNLNKLAEPSNTEHFLLKRHLATGYSVQCSSCRNWRLLKEEAYRNRSLPLDWKCTPLDEKTVLKCYTKEIAEYNRPIVFSKTTAPRSNEPWMRIAKEEIGSPPSKRMCTAPVELERSRSRTAASLASALVPPKVMYHDPESLRQQNFEEYYDYEDEVEREELAPPKRSATLKQKKKSNKAKTRTSPTRSVTPIRHASAGTAAMQRQKLEPFSPISDDDDIDIMTIEEDSQGLKVEPLASPSREGTIDLCVESELREQIDDQNKTIKELTAHLEKRNQMIRKVVSILADHGCTEAQELADEPDMRMGPQRFAGLFSSFWEENFAQKEQLESNYLELQSLVTPLARWAAAKSEVENATVITSDNLNQRLQDILDSLGLQADAEL